MFIYEPGDTPKLYNNKARPERTYNNRRYDISVVKLYNNISNINLVLHNYYTGKSISGIKYS